MLHASHGLGGGHLVGQLTGRLDDLFLTGLLGGLQILYAQVHAIEYLHVEARSRLGYLLGGSQRLFLHEDRARLTHLAGRQYGSDLHGRSLGDVERSRIYGRFRGRLGAIQRVDHLHRTVRGECHGSLVRESHEVARTVRLLGLRDVVVDTVSV